VQLRGDALEALRAQISGEDAETPAAASRLSRLGEQTARIGAEVQRLQVRAIETPTPAD
jgi:hypothetical protein